MSEPETSGKRPDSTLRRGDLIVLEAESLSGEGTSVGRHEGMVCFIEDAVPGDLAEVRLFKIKRNHLLGRAVRILRPSPERREPRCGHFGTCGGCRWQNYAYEAQLAAKRRRVSDVFQRISGLRDVEVLETIGCADCFHYRNKMEFTFSGERWRTADELDGENVRADRPGPPGPFLGLHPAGWFDKVVDLRECHLPSPAGAAILLAAARHFRGRGLDAYSTRTHRGYLRHLVIREGKRTGETMVNLVTTDDRPAEARAFTEAILREFPAVTTVVNNVTDRKSMVARGDREVVLHGPGTIRERIGRFHYRISANSFFQTNTEQAEALFREAAEMADLRPSDIVYDLYCGTGAIALYVSDRVGRVIGVESNAAAVADAKRNAADNGADNCLFVEADLPDGIGPGGIEAGGSAAGGKAAAAGSGGSVDALPLPTVVIVDPPRSGLHAKLIGRIIALAPERVVYVSCNAATQARDVAFFGEGGYRPGPVRPVDMFPHTDHVETVTVLRRSGSPG